MSDSLEDTTFSTPSFVPSLIQELVPPDLAPSSSPNGNECQVETAQVLAQELFPAYCKSYTSQPRPSTPTPPSRADATITEINSICDNE